MKQIDELIEKYRDKEVKSIEASKEFAKQKMEFSEMTSQAFAFAYDSIQKDLETLKEQLKEQHKEDVVKAYKSAVTKCISIQEHGFKVKAITAEQYYQQTHEEK